MPLLLNFYTKQVLCHLVLFIDFKHLWRLVRLLLITHCVLKKGRRREKVHRLPRGAGGQSGGLISCLLRCLLRLLLRLLPMYPQ